MFALRQIIEDPQDFIPVPPALRHRKTEVIFIVLDDPKPPPALDARSDEEIIGYDENGLPR